MRKILLTGGSGLLGQELQKHIECDAPSHNELDITKPHTLTGKYDMIIHSAAYTDVPMAEKETMKCLDINILGTINLLRAFPTTPFVYISSEYAKEPTNFYSKTKQIAEEIVDVPSGGYDGAPVLILRTLFKPNPFPWDKAFIDQYTQGDYVDVIAPLIVKTIKKWRGISYGGIKYVGTGRKTMYALAKRTKPDVGKISIRDIKDVVIPADYL